MCVCECVGAQASCCTVGLHDLTASAVGCVMFFRWHLPPRVCAGVRLRFCQRAREGAPFGAASSAQRYSHLPWRLRQRWFEYAHAYAAHQRDDCGGERLEDVLTKAAAVAVGRAGIGGDSGGGLVAKTAAQTAANAEAGSAAAAVAKWAPPGNGGGVGGTGVASAAPLADATVTVSPAAANPGSSDSKSRVEQPPLALIVLMRGDDKAGWSCYADCYCDHARSVRQALLQITSRACSCGITSYADFCISFKRRLLRDARASNACRHALRAACANAAIRA
jgi:hypothetical protein